MGETGARTGRETRTIRHCKKRSEYDVPVEKEHVLGIRRRGGPYELDLVGEGQNVVVEQNSEADSCGGRVKRVNPSRLSYSGRRMKTHHSCSARRRGRGRH